jgi:RNA polymerase sigma-54 factor
MAGELKQVPGLVLRPTQIQKLILTPKLQQAISLLQLSTIELSVKINQEIEENPVLEEMVAGEAEVDTIAEHRKDEPIEDSFHLPEKTPEEHPRREVDWDNYLSGYKSSRAHSAHNEKDFPPFENATSAKSDLSSHLMWQLNMTNLDEEQKEIAAYIVGNLDEDGYLDLQVEEISLACRCSEEKALETLHLVQNLDPVGVAARDIKECLLIQAKLQNLGGTIVEKIITDHLIDLENRRYEHIAKRLSVPVEEVITAVSTIQGMEPKPGRNFSDERTVYVTPDIYVFKAGDDYEIAQNEDGLPKLRISAYYKNVLASTDSLSDSAKTYIREKLSSATWLIRSIEQRKRTIYRVTKSICRFQRDFLDRGITHLKPLVLRDVAEDIKMHESTVSRATTNKWVHTPQGIFELKFFFNSPINTTDGESIASESVKEQIRKIIKSEDARKPYSDQEVAEMLTKMGIDAARRTVAKYREMMGILTSRHRKQRY